MATKGSSSENFKVPSNRTSDKVPPLSTPIRSAVEQLNSEIGHLRTSVEHLFSVFSPVLSQENENPVAESVGIEVGCSLESDLIDLRERIEAVNKMVCDLASRSRL